MKSPSSAILESTYEQLDEKQRAEELLQERFALIGHIEAAFDAVTWHHSRTIDDYATADGDTMKVMATRTSTSDHNNIAGTDYLDIRGRMNREGVKQSASFPMYRLSKSIPTTDGGSLHPHYEIAVADPESETGYTTLALVEQSILDNPNDLKVTGSGKIPFDIFKSHSSLQATDMEKLKDSGLYVSPNAAAMLEEVQYITSVIAAEQPAGLLKPAA